MKKLLSILFLISLVFLVSCSSVSPEKVCSVDEDCVPATCCHASAAINKEFSPGCSGQMCTQECVPETIDCGQGEIKCVSGECQVILNE